MIVLRVFRLNYRLLAGILVLCFVAGSFYPYINNRLGERYVEVISWSAANKVVVVDPGHGGPDAGATSKEGLEEKEVTLAIGKKLANLFGQAGALVVLTRDGDYDLGVKEAASRKRSDLENRVKLVKEHEADLFISIHANSISSPKWHGAQTFYDGKSEESKKLAVKIQDELVRTLGNNTRKAKAGDYFVLREASVPAVIVEVGFLSNPEEARLLSDPVYQSRCAWAIYAGVIKYLSETQMRDGISSQAGD